MAEVTEVTAENFKFKEWAKDHNLNKDTTKLLNTQCLQEYESLVLVTMEDLRATGIAIGQLALLRKALSTIGNVNFTAKEKKSNQGEVADEPEVFADAVEGLPSTTDSSDTEVNLMSAGKPKLRPGQGKALPAPLLTAGKVLDDLMDSLDSNMQLDATSIPLNSSATQDYDPRVHLTLKAASKKVVKIYHFLPTKVKDRIQRSRRDRLYVTAGEEGAVTMHQRDPEQYHISPAEWNAANMRVMGHLLNTGELKRQDVELYMSYTVQINDMVDVYEWASILHFDARYREMQAEHGFRWGDLRLAILYTHFLPMRF